MVEQGLLDLCELGWIHDFEYVFHFVQEHNLFGAVDLGPVSEQTQNDLLCKGSILLEELDNTVRQLRMVHAQALDLVQRYQDSGQEKLVLLLQWQREPVDYRSEDFEQFRNAVEPLCLVYELEENVVDGAANIRAEVEELSVYAVECGLQEVALSWIFRVEQLEKLLHVSLWPNCAIIALLTFSTKLWSMYALAMFVLKSWLSMKRRKNS